MKHDILADMFCIIKNTEKAGKLECVVDASNLAGDVLKLMQKNKYIHKFEKVEDGKGGKFRVHLAGNINDCNIIKPRFSVQKDEFIKWEKRFLPASGVGMLIVSTSVGVMEHETAKEKGVGGKLIGFVY